MKNSSGVACPRTYSQTDVELLELLAVFEARESFHAFRQYMRPDLKKGWWQSDAAQYLIQWIVDLVAGLRPILIIEAPPQHGKSWLVIDFMAWLMGKHPQFSLLYASVSKRLGLRANLAIQRMMDSPKYKRVFPGTRIMERNPPPDVVRKTRNSTLLELMDPATGSFRNVTVNATIVGEGLDVGVIDDPLKGRKEANSILMRQRTWDWFTDDFLSRFSDFAGLIIILTRWHLDDPVGRLQEELKNEEQELGKRTLTVLRYPALAEPNAKLMPHDPRKPGSGDALFPEHKSRDFILKRKRLMRADSFESLYQQNPYIPGGNIFKTAWWRYYRGGVLPKIVRRVIYADTAQKDKEQNDYSVFQVWGVSADKQLYLLDQLRGKWEAPELKTQAIAFWNKHKAVIGFGPLIAFKVEDKVSGTGLIQDLKKAPYSLPMIGIPRNTKDKVERANDVTPHIEVGHVHLPEEAPWLSQYLLEFSEFPNGKHDDQVDPTMDAIADLLQGTLYTLSNVS
jgi:predicted phage terminase large subunit-like protein